MAECLQLTPVMYVIVCYGVYMMLVFPLTEFLGFLLHFTSLSTQDQYYVAHWIYLIGLFTFIPAYAMAFYCTWRRNRAKPFFVPRWKTDENLTEEDLLCTICYELIVEPQTLRCQHSFCGKCIEQSLRLSKKCPSCQQMVLWCNPDKKLKNKIVEWVKANGREEDYKELVELKKTVKVQKSLTDICSIFAPFFDPVEIRRPRRVHLIPMPPPNFEPIAPLVEPIVVDVIDEVDPPPVEENDVPMDIEIPPEPVASSDDN